MTEKYTCPYCSGELKAPTRKKACQHCKRQIYARTRPGGEKVWIKEEDVPAFEREWQLHHQKKMFFRQASETNTYVYSEYEKLEAQAKQSFKSGDRDAAWGLHNQALLRAGEKQDNLNWASRFRGVYFTMACQLAAEERYEGSLTFFAKMLYWSCLDETISEINYRRAVDDLDTGKSHSLNFTLKADYVLPPFMLEPLLTAIRLANSTPDQFSELFARVNEGESRTATALIKRHESASFDAPTAEMFWKIIGPVIHNNLHIGTSGV